MCVTGHQSRIVRLFCVLLVATTGIAQVAKEATNTELACAVRKDEIHAARLKAKVPAGEFPREEEWQRAVPISFCSDWQAKNADPMRATEARLLWSDDAIYVRFRCHYRELYMIGPATLSGRKDHLWESDVAEAFLQADHFGQHLYKEFEVSPSGLWLDLDVFQSSDTNLDSGMRAVASVDSAQRVWTAQIFIPMRSITTRFDPHSTWRVNFFRVEGRAPNRAYLAWRPTHTPEPDFHRHEAFGLLWFDE